MPKKTTKKREKPPEEEALDILEKLTKGLEGAINSEPELRKKADELAEVITKSHSKDSFTFKSMKTAIRVLLVADTIEKEKVEIKDVAQMKAILTMTAETVFGLSRLEAIVFARGVGDDVFETYKEEREKDDTTVYKTLIALSVCLENFKESVGE
jgi:hypothetical protein|nr:MAG TPA: hypothetical protein [Caudoviricetes sp.]